MRSPILPIVLLLSSTYFYVGQLRPLPEWLHWMAIPTDIAVPAGGDVGAAIKTGLCGDRIRAQAGATWDTPSPYVYDKKCGPESEFTITTAGTLPNMRIVPAHVTTMPRFRTTSGNAVFQSAPNASGLILDGLEITDNVTDNRVVNYLLDFASNPGARNITVTRSYVHPKEIGTTDYTRNAVRAVGFEGSGFLGKWNYIAGFLGRQPDGQLPTTQVMLCISCNNVTWEDNFLQAWYAVFFTGGGGSPPQHTATVSNASATSATFSHTTGLAPGILLRLSLTGTATSDGILTPYKDVVGDFQSSLITRTGGEVLINFDATGTQQGYHIRFVPVGGGATYRGRVKSVLGNSIRVVWEYGAPAPSGGYTWTMWAVAKVGGVSGSTVNYTGYGPNRLLQAPTAGGQSTWRESAVVHSWKVLKNTIDTPYDYSIHEHAANGNSPKGNPGEFKDMNGLLHEGNLHTGYPSVFGLSNRSNEGGTPWSTMRNLTIRSNFFNYTLNAAAIRQMMIAQTDDYSNSATPGANIVITNNLVKGVNVIAQTDAMVNATITFNTFLNDNVNSLGNSILFGLSPSSGLVFENNIVAHNEYGMNCTIGLREMCWPVVQMRNNVVVNNKNSLNVNTWSAGSLLSPTVTSFTQVGFVNLASNDYRLSASSPFKGKGTGGSDPGVDWNALVVALGFDPSGATVPTPAPVPAPVPTPIPPTPAPTPTAPKPPSPDGTKAVSIVDSTGSIWTLDAQKTLRDGVHVGAGFGSIYKWLGGVVYVLGTNNWWYKWTGSSWVSVSLQEPGTSPLTRIVDWPKQPSKQNPIIEAQWRDRYRLKRIDESTTKAEFEKVP